MTWPRTSARRAQLPPDWPARRKARLELDQYRCTAPITVGQATTESVAGMADVRVERCPARAIDVDHDRHPADHRIEALRSLCAWHHKEKTQAEAQRARGVGAARLRKKQPHPGLIDP